MTPTPCQREPERWVDRDHRNYARRHCLVCPRRRWCALQALEVADYGMWAGIWIDHDRSVMAPHLLEIVQDTR